MPDEKPAPDEEPAAEARKNADEIERMERTDPRAQGNVYSEPDEPVDQAAPPPLPN